MQKTETDKDGKPAGKHEGDYGHVLKYTGIFGGVQGLNILIGLLRTKIVARLLGPAGMGLMSLFNTTVNFISQLTSLGISFSAVRHVSELFDSGDEARISHFIKVVRAWCLLAGLLGMLVCMLAGPLLSLYTFAWGNHTLHFVMLSPVVFLMAISGGEMAILKGTRRLKAVASVQVFAAVVSVLVSVPIYYFWNQTGVVPVIFLMALSTLLATVWYSYRFYPLRLCGVKGIFGEGMEMVRLGVGFTIAGIFASGADIVTRSFINVEADLDVLGLYNAGYMLTMTYGGMIFSAMDTDYFPRLSSLNNKQAAQMNETVNHQIEVTLLLIAPMLVALLFGAPLLVPLLLTTHFNPIVGMVRIAVFALFLRAILLPIAYLPLARGDGHVYMLTEGICALVMVAAMVLCFQQWGLTGTGVALLTEAFINLLVAYVIGRWRYGYRFSSDTIRFSLLQLVVALASFRFASTLHSWPYWLLAVVMTGLSLMLSFHYLQSRTTLWNEVKAKFTRH